jgi:hypothetical protein
LLLAYATARQRRHVGVGVNVEFRGSAGPSKVSA